MKKIVALFLCFAMVAGLLTGCQKPMDVDTLTQKMDEAGKTVNAQSSDTTADLELEIAASGVTMTVKMAIEAAGKSQKEPAASYTDLKMTLELMGEKQEMAMEMYTALDGDTMMSYSYDSTTDMWTKAAQENYAEEAAKLEEAVFTFGELPKEKLTLAEEKELVGERECYVLTADIDGTCVAEVLNAMMEAEQESLEGLDEQTRAVVDMLKETDLSGVNIHAVYHVDAETFLPLQYSGEVTGVGEVMNSMFAELMAMLGGELPEGVEFSADVPVFKFAVTNLVYEGVEIPAVPQEAIDNAVTSEDMDQLLMEQQLPGGGTYEMTLGADTVTVVLPAAYGCYYEDSEIIGAATADYSADVTYMLFSDYATEEELVTDLQSEVEWAKQEGLYLSHTEPADYNGYRTMTLSYNDNTASQYFWRELGEGFLIIDLYTEGTGTNVDEVLNAVQIP